MSSNERETDKETHERDHNFDYIDKEIANYVNLSYPRESVKHGIKA